MTRNVFRATAAALALTCAACGGDDDSSSAAPGARSDGGEDATSAPFLELDEILAIEPGPPTTCARGTPYRFFAIGGDPSRLVIDFAGGGACWSEATCSLASSTFVEEAWALADVEAYNDGDERGLYRRTAQNPFGSFSYVSIPYCTGDVHWGDATVSYSSDVEIHHRGHRNAMAALEWIFSHYDPELIFVTGQSAGSYGGLVHVPAIADQYPSAAVRYLGDAGAGVVTNEFMAESFDAWNSQIPRLGALAGADLSDLRMPDLYDALTSAYPDVRFAQHNHAFDNIQTFYYQAMGGAPEDWAPEMRALLTTIAAAAPNFTYYVSPGPLHGTLGNDAFYDRVIHDVSYVEWLERLVTGGELPEAVACDGDECLSDAICDGCAAGERPGPECQHCSAWPPL